MRVRLGLLLLSMVLAPVPGSAVRAGEVLPGPIPAQLVEVIDGDTVAVRAQIWLGQSVEIHVRLAGIDAPELHGHCAAEAGLAERARAALGAVLAGGPVLLRAVRNDRYGGRVVAQVATESGTDAAAALLAAGLARPYAGRGTHPDWCAAAAGPDR